MKLAIKHKFSKIGIWPYLDLVRRLPEITEWIDSGCSGIAPPPVKRKILAAYLRRFDLHQFVETGTHLGDTLADIAHDGSIKCVSIELADSYYRDAVKRFASYPNVTLHKGDSGTVLPELVQTLNAPALFWLDGHYSGALTARGEVDTPVSEELQAILDSPIKNHVILIDDARCFDGTTSYPYLDELQSMVRATSTYDIEVSADIVRLTPKGRP